MFNKSKIVTSESLVISTIVSLIFYHSDPLFKGDNSVTKWIRTLFASNLLVKKFNVDIHKANSLWFKYFNQWQHKEHPNHSFLKKSHSSSYSARLIYFTSIVCLIYGFIGILIYGLTYLGEANHSYLVLSLSYILFGGILFILNSPPKFEDGQLTKPVRGVWHSVESSFLETKSRFDSEVVSKCDSFVKAEELVDSTSKQWMN